MKLKDLFHPFSCFKQLERQRKTNELLDIQDDAVNVMEFDGELCLSVDGMPIFSIKDLGIDYEAVPSILQGGRERWLSWQMRKL